MSYKANYEAFKQMEKQKQEKQLKEWVAQEKRMRQLKAQGVTKKKAVEEAKNTRKKSEGGGSKKKRNDAVASGQAEAETKVCCVFACTCALPPISDRWGMDLYRSWSKGHENIRSH